MNYRHCIYHRKPFEYVSIYTTHFHMDWSWILDNAVSCLNCLKPWQAFFHRPLCWIEHFHTLHQFLLCFTCNLTVPADSLCQRMGHWMATPKPANSSLGMTRGCRPRGIKKYNLRSWDYGGPKKTKLWNLEATKITGWWFGTWLDYDFPFSWEFHSPKWRTHIFQRGRYTTNQSRIIFNWIVMKICLSKANFLAE